MPCCRGAAGAASQSGTCVPGMLLLLSRLTSFMEASTLVRIMETLAAVFPGQGASAGGDQPPAFVAGEVARCRRTRIRLDARLLTSQRPHWPRRPSHRLQEASNGSSSSAESEVQSLFSRGFGVPPLGSRIVEPFKSIERDSQIDWNLNLLFPTQWMYHMMFRSGFWAD